MERTRAHNIWPIAREGFPFVLIGAGLTVLLWLLGLTIPALFFSALTAFVIYFFRDPERHTPQDPNAIVTPADGTVLAVRQVGGDENPSGREALLVSIFMSVFNVHVNRAPAQGRVTDVSYHPGKFFAASLDKASLHNENNRITLETPERRLLMLVQIAGLIARRIVCWTRTGDSLEAGQRFGLIRFGSRVDLYLPADIRVVVEPRSRVRAGETVIGYWI